MKNRLIQIVLTGILALSFIACEDKKEFKDTLGIEKEVKVKLPKPEWDTRLQNYDDTGVWFQEADDNEIAAYNIGVIYAQKLKDYNNAIIWYLYSDSIKSDKDNLFNMANSYRNLKKYNKSIENFKKSYKKGKVKAASNLAYLYKINLKDYKKSEEWYKIAIEREYGVIKRNSISLL
jgi:tetratricopeptide (TPR) repeat protein